MELKKAFIDNNDYPELLPFDFIEQNGEDICYYKYHIFPSLNRYIYENVEEIYSEEF